MDFWEGLEGFCFCYFLFLFGWVLVDAGNIDVVVVVDVCFVLPTFLFDFKIRAMLRIWSQRPR